MKTQKTLINYVHIGKPESSDLGESLGVEYGIEVGSYFGFSGECVERKLEVFSGESEKGASGARVKMVIGLLALDAGSVAAVAAVSARASDQRSEVRCSRAAVE